MRFFICVIVVALAYVAQLRSEAPTKKVEKQFDCFGDELPVGAIVRLGIAACGHPGAQSISFNSTSSQFETWSNDGRVSVWDAKTGRCLRAFAAPELRDGSTTTCIAGNGRLVATRNEVGVEIWNVELRKQVCILPLAKDNECSAVTFSRNNDFVVFAEASPARCRICLFDLTAGRLRQIGTLESRIDQILLSPDEKTIYANSRAGENCSAWDLGKSCQIWLSKDCSFYRLEMNGNGRQLCGIGTHGFSAFLLNPSTGLWHTRIAVKNADRVALSPKGDELAVLRRDAGIEIINRRLGRFWTLDVEASSIAYRSDGEAIYVIERSGMVEAYDLKTRQRIFNGNANFHTAPVNEIVWSEDGRRIASSARGNDPRILIWDTVSGHLIQQLLPRRLKQHEWSADGTQIYAVNHDGSVNVFYVGDRNLSAELIGPMSTDDQAPLEIVQIRRLTNGLFDVALARTRRTSDKVIYNSLQLARFDAKKSVFGPFRHVVLSGNSYNDPRLGAYNFVDRGTVYSLETGLPGPLLGSEADTLCNGQSSFSKDERIVVSGERKWISENSGHSFEVGPIRREPGVFGSYATTNLTIFERATGRPICLITKPASKHCSFSPDGRYLACIQADGLHIWHLPSGQVSRFKNAQKIFDRGLQSCRATSVAFSSDGKRIATGHKNGTILIWDATPLLCSVPNPLTKTEIEAIWGDLANPDAKIGWDAIWKLQDRPEQALSFFSQVLRPCNLTAPNIVNRLLDALDAEAFHERQQASIKLAQLGDAAKAALILASKARNSPEKAERVQKLLARLDSLQAPTNEDLRHLRCLAVLEYINTEECRKIVRKIAHGYSGARLTIEASQTLQRMQ